MHLVQKLRQKSNSGGDPKGHRTGARAPLSPNIFYKHNITSLCTILQVYGHHDNVPFKRLVLLGPVAIVDNFTGSGARRLRFVL